MRNTFINEIHKNALINNEICFLTGDLGFGVLNQMREELGDRFKNIGVAEQLMTGMAAGMAIAGKKTFTYSIANFPTLRCIEQIRNDICYHNLDVKIVSVGAGVAYGTHGYTHFGVEDIAMMRTLQNMEVICPLDPVEARAAANYVCENSGPVYIRLGKNGEPNIHNNNVKLIKGKFLEHHPRAKNIVLSTGSIGLHAKLAVEKLKEEGVDICFVSAPFVRPLDRDFLCDSNIEKIFTVEEHSPFGGFGAAILEELSDLSRVIPVKRFTLPEKIEMIASQKYLLSKYHLDEKGLYESIKNQL